MLVGKTKGMDGRSNKRGCNAAVSLTTIDKWRKSHVKKGVSNVFSF